MTDKAEHGVAEKVAAALAAATAEGGGTDGRRCQTVRQGVEQQ